MCVSWIALCPFYLPLFVLALLVDVLNVRLRTYPFYATYVYVHGYKILKGCIDSSSIGPALFNIFSCHGILALFGVCREFLLNCFPKYMVYFFFFFKTMLIFAIILCKTLMTFGPTKVL